MMGKTYARYINVKVLCGKDARPYNLEYAPPFEEAEPFYAACNAVTNATSLKDAVTAKKKLYTLVDEMFRSGLILVHYFGPDEEFQTNWHKYETRFFSGTGSTVNVKFNDSEVLSFDWVRLAKPEYVQEMYSGYWDPFLGDLKEKGSKERAKHRKEVWETYGPDDTEGAYMRWKNSQL